MEGATPVSARASASASASAPTPTPTLTERGARTRERLIQATREVFEEMGFLETRVSHITPRAKVAYGTEASIFQAEGGIPSVVVGPGNIEQAHKPDEFIEIAELERCNAFIDRLIAHCCA